jgi:CRISPR/Cas system endoribonuclease Cas6 (RAMP superfamily)
MEVKQVFGSILDRLEPAVLRCHFVYSGHYRDKNGAVVQGPARIPDFTGSMLRGLFGRALHALHCRHNNGRMENCPHMATCGCLYSDAFSAAGKRDSAKAFVLLAPEYVPNRPYLKAGEPLEFKLIFHPALTPKAGELIQAACAMTEQGFGSRQAAFSVAGVEWIAKARELPEQIAPGTYRLGIRFTNPTELWEGEKRSHPSLENILHSAAARGLIWSGILPDHTRLNAWLQPAARAIPTYAHWELTEGLQMEAEAGEKTIKPAAWIGEYRWKIGHRELQSILPALRLLPLLGAGGRTTRGMGNVRVQLEAIKD